VRFSRFGGARAVRDGRLFDAAATDYASRQRPAAHLKIKSRKLIASTGSVDCRRQALDSQPVNEFAAGDNFG